MTPQILKSNPLATPAEARLERSVFEAFLDACKTNGTDTAIVTDGNGIQFTYGKLRQAAYALSAPLMSRTEKDETIGVLLPTSAGAVIALLSIYAAGRIPAMLNFSAGIKNLEAAARTAPINFVLTSRKFIKIAKLEKLTEQLAQHVTLLYLEDLKGEIGLKGKIRALLGPRLPALFTPQQGANETGVVLFTSGTEGAPKGVALTHANVLANTEQIEQHVEIKKEDVFFNPLPIFHSYGLTAGTLWPILSGHPVVLHPSPLQTKTIAKRIYETRATVLFATDTFLQQYMRASKDGELSSLRIAVCGAERVREETRKTAWDKFTFEVLEGYGVTECAPVLAVNQPGDIRDGTIGKMLPGIETRLEPVEGLHGAGRLFVRGPNIMKGYISPDKPGHVMPLEGGWHDTGDIVSVDDKGYYQIEGRAKRFAKIGGEMVSLTVVETCAAGLWPDHMHAAAIAADPKKGERIILVTDHPDPKRSTLLDWAQKKGIPEISVPKKILSVDELPVLGTGKLDYVAITQMAVDAES